MVSELGQTLGSFEMKSGLIGAVVAGAILTTLSGASMSADYRQNPFTLAYDGAITENVTGKVNLHPVHYRLNGLDISANVYTPPNYDSRMKYPAIVLAHP